MPRKRKTQSKKTTKSNKNNNNKKDKEENSKVVENNNKTEKVNTMSKKITIFIDGKPTKLTELEAIEKLDLESTKKLDLMILKALSEKPYNTPALAKRLGQPYNKISNRIHGIKGKREGLLDKELIIRFGGEKKKVERKDLDEPIEVWRNYGLTLNADKFDEIESMIADVELPDPKEAEAKYRELKKKKGKKSDADENFPEKESVFDD